MPKQGLNEAKSSPAASNQDSGTQRRQPIAATLSAPTFFDDCLQDYHYYGYQENYDESHDKRQGLFRNRLFSTWTGQAGRNETSPSKLGRDLAEWKTATGRAGKSARTRIGSSSSAASFSNQEQDENVDAGYAWIILTVMFVINASTFGTARAYGLIFENSARRDEQSRSQAALPFTIMGAVENMAGPLTGYLLARTGSWRTMVFVGSCLITLSHLLAAYCDSQQGQIVTIGLMCGLGQSFISISSFQINNAYFVRYRSRAFGIGLTGAAVGTFYISPLCQFVLDNHTRSLCYLMLGLILLPNVPLSLLLKPKRTPIHISDDDDDDDNDLSYNESPSKSDPLRAQQIRSAAPEQPPARQPKQIVFSISGQLVCNRNGAEANETEEAGFWRKVNQVLSTPVFHLIWPTQLLFCWLNFVFGMIITDFGKDRGLSETQNSHLIVIWASGQLFGRLCLGSLVDLRILSYKSFTMVCFASISLITFMLNNFGTSEEDRGSELASNVICLLVFILSMFISTLYLLFNSLIVNYMDKSLTALSIGISSFTGSFFLLPRANIIGYYRDTCGNYDAMLTMFTYVTTISALIWLIMPALCSHVRASPLGEPPHTGSISQVNELLNDCSLSGHTISGTARPDIKQQPTSGM